MYVDAIWGNNLECGGDTLNGGYEAGFDWAAGAAGNPVILGTRTSSHTRQHWLATDSHVRADANAGRLLWQAAEVGTRRDLPDFCNDYDPWDTSHIVGGAHVQRWEAVDGPRWKTFGNIPLPTIGDGDAFRIVGRHCFVGRRSRTIA